LTLRKGGRDHNEEGPSLEGSIMKRELAGGRVGGKFKEKKREIRSHDTKGRSESKQVQVKF